MKFQSVVLPAALALSLMSATAQVSLKETFKDHFRMGTALNESQFLEKNQEQVALVKSHFNSITAENVMKWDRIQPREGEFQFDLADKFVLFGKKNNMFVIGHTLVWHSQVPGWAFKNADGTVATRETLLARMRAHIHKVVGRYKGHVKGWDVVNEVLEEDGTLRKSPWFKIIGEDYIAKAFEYAHEADPAAELYYNDYSIEANAKSAGAIALVKKLKAAGVPITGVGIQEHVDLNWPPTNQLDDTIRAFGELGVKVMITELDVNILPSRNHSTSADVSRREAADPVLNPYVDGLPDDKQQALAKRYADLFAVYLKHSKVVSRVTFWGVSDGDSWLNGWPIPGRTSYPLLFDRANKPKPAFQAVIDSVKNFERPNTPRSKNAPVRN